MEIVKVADGNLKKGLQPHIFSPSHYRVWRDIGRLVREENPAPMADGISARYIAKTFKKRKKHFLKISGT